MAEQGIITATDETFNPWLGCARVSPGCAHCFAERLVEERMQRPGLWGAGADRHVTGEATWSKPLAWQRRAARTGKRLRVFCATLCDVFEDHPVANTARPRLWRLIRSCPNLDWQLLTKRPENIAANLPADWGRGWPNVWLGTSVETQAYTWRLDELLRVPAALYFVVAEPLLGPLDLHPYLRGTPRLDWVIVGGESGPGHRPMRAEWAADLRKQCAEAGVAFYFKQHAARRPESKIELEGRVVRELPASRRVPLDVIAQGELFS